MIKLIAQATFNKSIAQTNLNLNKFFSNLQNQK